MGDAVKARQAWERFAGWVKWRWTLPATFAVIKGAYFLQGERYQALERRCAGAELALKRLAEGAEREIAGRDLPGLSPAQIERLALLAEECGGVIHVVGKVLRHGYSSASPFGGAKNQVALERELGDLGAAVQMIESAGDVRRGDVKHWQAKKAVNVHKWLHHQ